LLPEFVRIRGLSELSKILLESSAIYSSDATSQLSDKSRLTTEPA